MKTGLFFGTFNPVHTGHMIIAHYMAEFTDLEEVWFIVSPKNPFKQKDKLLNEYDRLHLINLAIDDHPALRASNVEFNLPQPSYTSDTLIHLKEKHPKRKFVLIMGSDNLKTFHKWKNHEVILRDHEIYLYTRPNYTEVPLASHNRVKNFEVPLLHISASFIRKAIKKRQSVNYFLPDKVRKYIEEMHYFEQ